MHVHVEMKELQLLDGDAAVAVDDRLRQPGRAGREQDEQRVRERHLLEVKRVAPRIRTSDHVLPEQCARRNWRAIVRIEIRKMHNVLERRQLADDLADIGVPIERLSAVAVAVDAEQQLRRELRVTIEYAPRSEVRSTACPHGADARGGEHRDDRSEEHTSEL